MKKSFIYLFSVFQFIIMSPVASYANPVISDIPLAHNTANISAFETVKLSEVPLSVFEENNEFIRTDGPSSGVSASTLTVYVPDKKEVEQEEKAESSEEIEKGPGVSLSAPSEQAGTNTNLRNELIDYAKEFLGNPYVYGETSLTNGTDCSGYTMRIFEKFGIKTGRDSRTQAKNCRKISKDELQPGDLIFYASGDYINHVAIYIGNDQIIHAADSNSGIITSYAYYREPYLYGTFL